jgi:hypothetical protein
MGAMPNEHHYARGMVAGSAWAKTNPDRCQAIGLTIATALQNFEAGRSPDASEATSALAKVLEEISPEHSTTAGDPDNSFAQGVQQAILDAANARRDRSN